MLNEPSYSYEKQWVNGELTKVNFCPVGVARIPYGLLKQEFPEVTDYIPEELHQWAVDFFGRGPAAAFSIFTIPATLSKNSEGKITAYFGTMDNSLTLKALKKFNVPLNNKWSNVFSISKNSEEVTLKLYSLDFSNENIPELPEGALLGDGDGVGSYGVAYNFNDKGETEGACEAYFRAEYSKVKEWAEPKGLKLPETSDIDYWGVSFTPDLIPTKLKALKWVMEEIGPVEECWSDGKLLRVGKHRYHPDSVEAITNRLVGNFGDLLKINNVGSSVYCQGERGEREIISLYYEGSVTPGIADSFKLTDSDTIGVAPWYGIKYCPELQSTWLKLAYLDHDKYPTPELPSGVTRAFGYAKVYPMRGTKGKSHNGSGNWSVDCSFITRDHALVRDWCSKNNLADPAPFAPDKLDQIGVYSLTYHPDTLQIYRIKFYRYFTHQKFDMECYLRGIVKGSELNFSEAFELFKEMCL